MRCTCFTHLDDFMADVFPLPVTIRPDDEVLTLSNLPLQRSLTLGTQQSHFFNQLSVFSENNELLHYNVIILTFISANLSGHFFSMGRSNKDNGLQEYLCEN